MISLSDSLGSSSALLRRIYSPTRLHRAADLAFSHTAALTAAGAWIGALTYSLQLYFDFSGYSDMALGLARMFSIRFPLNFNSPYKAKNVIEFWQR